MKLLLLNQSRDRVSEAWLRKWVAAIHSHLPAKLAKGLKKKELVVVFVNSGEMKRLNSLYRQKNYATDVLSFESGDPTTIGELVICLPVVRSQSKRTGLGEKGELGYMIVHGVLHLLGMDHDKPEAEAEMFALQDRVYGTLERRVGLR